MGQRGQYVDLPVILSRSTSLSGGVSHNAPAVIDLPGRRLPFPVMIVMRGRLPIRMLVIGHLYVLVDLPRDYGRFLSIVSHESPCVGADPGDA
jgi:hypothetical protein